MIPLEMMTIETIHQKIVTKEVSCEKLIDAYIGRIKTYNLSSTSKPPINAITQLNPHVMEEARKLDQAFQKQNKLTGPLHCIPVVLKDNIDSFDTYTTAGSFALIGTQPKQDAFLVDKLRQAGALFIAKAAMDEFGWGLYGLNSRVGRVGNVYDTTLNPGGSSSGVAAAVSADFAVVGIGTDNSGSIRIPAVFNGILGLRPSTGLVSQNGVFPMGNLDAVAGPITKNIKDMAVVLTVIANTKDPKDKKTELVPREKNYVSLLENGGLKNKRLGIVRQIGLPQKGIEDKIQNTNPFTNLSLEHQSVLNHFFQRLKNLGAILVDPILLPEFDNNREFNQAGEKEDVDAYFAAFPGTRKNFQDICESDRSRVFGTVKECLHFIQTLPKSSSAEYRQVLEIARKNKQTVEKIMRDNQLDALIMPVSREGGPTYDPFSINTWFTPLASNAGLPSLAFVAGYDTKTLPVGVEFIGKQYEEAVLLLLVYDYEKNQPSRILPHLEASTDKLTLSSISEWNNFLTLLGQTTYEQILKENKSLSAEQFRVLFTTLKQNAWE